MNAMHRRVSFPFPPVDEPRGQGCLAALADVARRTGAPAGQIALRYLLEKQGIATVIVGARSLDQLRENLGASELALDAEAITALDEASALAPEYPGWMLTRQGTDRQANSAAISQLPRRS